VVVLVAGAAATSVLFATDAFFAFAGWRILIKKKSWGRDCVGRLHSYTEKREPLFAVIAMVSALVLALQAGTGHPRASCLACGAIMALGAHLLIYTRTAALMQSFKAAPVGSGEWHAGAARLEVAMVTRASLQAAALICIVTAGVMV
jgi:hypothetical protein